MHKKTVAQVAVLGWVMMGERMFVNLSLVYALDTTFHSDRSLGCAMPAFGDSVVQVGSWLNHNLSNCAPSTVADLA